METNASPVVHSEHFRAFIMSISQSPLAASLSLFYPGPSTRVNASNSAQLVEHFIHALQPDALTACAITLDHLVNAHCATMN
jgi:hypothetical protein